MERCLRRRGGYKGLPLVEDFVVEQEELFLDGPVSKRDDENAPYVEYVFEG